MPHRYNQFFDLIMHSYIHAFEDWRGKHSPISYFDHKYSISWYVSYTVLKEIASMHWYKIEDMYCHNRFKRLVSVGLELRKQHPSDLLSELRSRTSVIWNFTHPAFRVIHYSFAPKIHEVMLWYTPHLYINDLDNDSHIQSESKWPPFGTRNSQIMFLNENRCLLILNFRKIGLL